MNPLTGLDATFLDAETPHAPMNVVATVILEPDAQGEPLPFERIARRIEARVTKIPAFRRKLLEAPLGLDTPTWVDDPDFTPRDHMLRVCAEEPGGREELGAVVARIAAERLDRSRPLWKIWVVEGLAHDRTALVIKAHHAALDGVSGAALLVHLFDLPENLAPIARRKGEARRDAAHLAPVPEAEPGLAERFVSLATRLPVRALRSARAARSVAGALLGAAAEMPLEPSALAERIAGFKAPRTPWNGALSARRSVGYARVQRAQITRIRSVLGGTTNDVILAACSAALREMLQERGALTEAPLVAAIPVSTRRAGDAPGGNRISAMLCGLPTQIEDPESCLEAVRFETQRAKQAHARFGSETLAEMAEITPSALTRRALDAYSRFGGASHHAPLQNVVISNVPGPRTAFTFCGVQVRALRPHGPLMEGTGLNVTVMSYADSIDIGVLTCARMLPHAAPIADGIAGAIERLAKRANRIAELDEGEGLTPAHIA